MKRLMFAICIALCFQVNFAGFAIAQHAGVVPSKEPQLNRYRKEQQSLDAVLQRLRETLARNTSIEEELQLKVRQLEQAVSNIKMNISSNEDIERLLMTRRVELVVDIAGLNARQTATEKNQAEAAKKLNGPINEEIELLEILVDFAEKKRAHTRKLEQSGNVNSIEVVRAEQEITEAKLRLLERKNQSTRIDTTDKTLEFTSLELAEKKAQLEIVDKLLEDTAMAKSALNELVEVKSRLDQLKTARVKGQSELLQDIEKRFLETEYSIFRLENEEETKEDK